jgi:ABC-type branched-subunit amino acid transport system ATPase component
MADDDRPDLRDPEVLHRIFDGFAQEMGQIVESQQRLIKMANHLSGESLAMRAVLSALQQKAEVTVSYDEAMAALAPLMTPEMKQHEDQIREAVGPEIERLLAVA